MNLYVGSCDLYKCLATLLPRSRLSSTAKHPLWLVVAYCERRIFFPHPRTSANGTQPGGIFRYVFAIILPPLRSVTRRTRLKFLILDRRWLGLINLYIYFLFIRMHLFVPFFTKTMCFFY